MDKQLNEKVFLQRPRTRENRINAKIREKRLEYERLYGKPVITRAKGILARPK